MYRRAKALFTASRNSLDSRELSKKLREKGFIISRYRTQTFMRKLNLKIQQCVKYKATTKRKHSDAVADNLLNQNFNPVTVNNVWAGDITYLRTDEGWLYLAVIMDLYSRHIVGWSIDQRITQALISRAMIQAINLRQPKHALVFHRNHGSQYTSRHYRRLLAGHGIRALGACWDNVVVERFFGSLKDDRVMKVAQPTRDHIKQAVADYIRYYNNHRLHTANNNLSPINYKLSEIKVSG